MTDDEILRIEEAHAQECAQYADRIAELEVLLQNAVADAEEFQRNYARACHLIALAKEGEQASTNSVQLLLERAIIAEARAAAAEAEAGRYKAAMEQARGACAKAAEFSAAYPLTGYDYISNFTAEAINDVYIAASVALATIDAAALTPAEEETK